MKEYGAVIPATDLPVSPEYASYKNLLVSDDPPVLVTHELEHNYVPDIDYETYQDEGSTAVYQFFIQTVSDLDRLNEHGKDGVPMRIVLNHAVNHTDLNDDEAYEILMELSDSHDSVLRIDGSGRVKAE